MTKKLKLLIACIVVALTSYSIGRYTQPSKVEYRTQTVIKEVEVVKKDVRTVVKTVKHPDGTIERTKTVEDKSLSEVNKDTNSVTTQIIESKKLDWRVSGLASLKDGFPVYGLSIERRIAGNIYLGLYTVPDIPIGLSLGISF